MTAEELLSLYPDVRHAVAFTENTFCRPAPGFSGTSWEKLLRLRPSPARMVELIACFADRGIAGGGRLPAGLAPWFSRVREQMAHPQFLAYIRGKMGAY